MMGVKINPELSVGNLAIIGTLIVSIVGAVIAVKDDMRAGITKVETMVSEVRSENRLQDQRADMIERNLSRSQADDATFRSEVRQSLTTLSGDLAKLLADVRVIAATGEKAPPRR